MNGGILAPLWLACPPVGSSRPVARSCAAIKRLRRVEEAACSHSERRSSSMVRGASCCSLGASFVSDVEQKWVMWAWRSATWALQRVLLLSRLLVGVGRVRMGTRHDYSACFSVGTSPHVCFGMCRGATHTPLRPASYHSNTTAPCRRRTVSPIALVKAVSAHAGQPQPSQPPI